MSSSSNGCTVSRRRFLARAGLGALALAAGRRAPADDARPNLVFLLTDDQRWNMMGCAGNPIIHTPTMDALARDGVRFANAFVTTSICAASRASLFCGLYERTHRFTFGTPPIRKDHTDISYPQVLRGAGYRTGFVGKFGVQVQAGAREGMFDSFTPLGRNPYFKKQPDGSLRHLTDITADKAIAFLQGCKPGQPFCLSVSFNAPHAEDGDKRQYIWPKAADSLYRDAVIPVPKTADPAFFDKQPAFIKASLNRIRWRWRFDTPQKYQAMVKGHYRMISGVDAAIARLRAELERLGVADNTVIVLMGDNGYFLGERGFAGKWTGHEESLRVPLLVYDPRAPKALRGACPKPMALNVDIAPTLLDLAGVPVPKPMQGRSLVPLLKGETPADWRSDFFHEHLFAHGSIPKYEGVRNERYTYIRYFEQKPAYEELYDRPADPHQERNLASAPRGAAALATLRTRCDELRDAYGGPFVPHPRRSRPRRAARRRPSAFVDGVRGKAAAFDGRSCLRICAIPALPKAAAFSWAFWAYVEKDSKNSGVLIGNRHSGAQDTLQFMKVTPETVQLYNGRSHSVRLTHGLPRERWAHVAVVKEGPTLACFVDGRKVQAAAAAFDMPELPLYLGGDPQAGEMAVCRLDEVRLYRRALAPHEVAALAKKGDVADGLLAYWPLDDEAHPERPAGAPNTGKATP